MVCYLNLGHNNIVVYFKLSECTIKDIKTKLDFLRLNLFL